MDVFAIADHAAGPGKYLIDICACRRGAKLTENTVVQVSILASRVSHPKGLTQLSPGLSHSDQVTPLGP